MQTRKLGESDLNLSLIGLGTWAIGGPNWKYGWGPQSTADSIGAIHKALELGVNWIDTAPAYGLGKAELIVAKALKDWPEKVIIATKCGLIPEKDRSVKACLKKESIIQECEDSLRRLETEVIDLYQIHWPKEPKLIEEAWDTLLILKKQGKIRYPAISNFSVKQIKRLRPLSSLISLQTPLSLLSQGSLKETIPWSAKQNIGILAYSPLQSGLLSGRISHESIDSLEQNDWRKTKAQFFKEPQLTCVLNLVDQMNSLARELKRSTAELAIAWVLTQKGICSSIVGCRNPNQVEQIAGASQLLLSPNNLAQLNKIYLNFKNELKLSKNYKPCNSAIST